MSCIRPEMTILPFLLKHEPSKIRIFMPVQQGKGKIKDYLKKQFNLSSDQIDSMLPEFISTLADHLANLESALDQGDIRQLGKAGHTIKGALLNLGLQDCADIAYLIEKKGKASDNTVDYRGLVSSLRDKLRRYLT